MNRLELIKNLEDKEYRAAYMESSVRIGIALQIKALREERHQSQTDFAKIIAKPQPIVSRLESTEYGGVSVQTLIDIANSLDIGVSIQFCDYQEFLDRYDDVSPVALGRRSFHQINWMPPRPTGFAQTSTWGLRLEQGTRSRGEEKWKRQSLLGVRTFPGLEAQTTARPIQTRPSFELVHGTLPSSLAT